MEFHRAYWPGFKDDLPYSVCLVRLAEGPLMVSNLVGGCGKCEDRRRGYVVFEQATEEVTLPKFALVGSAPAAGGAAEDAEFGAMRMVERHRAAPRPQGVGPRSNCGS